tara:strand:+ start:103 stop:459 length:357 start_codon:yes stop_codon:yes gene_type:complete
MKIVISILLSCGAMLSAASSTPPEVELVKKGEVVYKSTCFACHGLDGKGMVPGTPDLTGKKSPLMQDTSVIKKRILEGFQSEGSQLAMPAKGGNPTLKESEVDAVILYMRKAFLPQSQ